MVAPSRGDTTNMVIGKTGCTLVGLVLASFFLAHTEAFALVRSSPHRLRYADRCGIRHSRWQPSSDFSSCSRPSAAERRRRCFQTISQRLPAILPCRKIWTMALPMSLIPLSADELSDLISVDTTPTAAQYTAYWGRTPRERYNRLFETLLVSILGMVLSYCLSFVLGGFVATILGAVFLFWGIFTPQLQAIQRNWEFLGGRQLLDFYNNPDDHDNDDHYNDNPRNGLYGALFLGYLDDVCVVEYAAASAEQEYDLTDFMDYTMKTDELEKYTGNPYLLRVRLADSQGRQLQVHARLSEDYLELLPKQGALALLLSTSKEFDQLAALSDLYVPGVQTYIGDYPYLHRQGVDYVLATDDAIWNTLQEQEQLRTKQLVTQQSLNHRRNGSPRESFGSYGNEDEEDINNNSGTSDDDYDENDFIEWDRSTGVHETTS